jgi:hypothetical protein
VGRPARPADGAHGVLPGPNVVGLWFLYRAINHWLAIAGIRRVATRKIATEFHAHDVLNEPLSSEQRGCVENVAAELGLKGLGTFLRVSERPSARIAEDEPLPCSAPGAAPGGSGGPVR